MQPIRSVRELAGGYDALLCDVWGVLHDGREVFTGVADLLVSLRAAGTVVVLLSNVPRPGAVVAGSLLRLGLPRGAWDAIVTSGDAIRPELAARAPGPMHRLGRDTDRALWEGLGLQEATLDRARFLAMAGPWPGEAPQAYADVLRAARGRDLELLCANPDVRVQSGDRLVWCAGAIAGEYAALGGRVVQAGKPHAPIYRRARTAVDHAAGRAVPANRILAIGDGIGTDILGANRVGLDSLLIASGVDGESLLVDGHLDVGRAGEALGAAAVSATYAMTRLA